MCRREGPDVEQFARDNIDTIQVIGLGTQDDFELAIDFLDRTGVETPTMLWDPGFTIWQAFEIRANSQMMVLSPDLARGSNLLYGFDEDQRNGIVEFAASL